MSGGGECMRFASAPLFARAARLRTKIELGRPDYFHAGRGVWWGSVWGRTMHLILASTFLASSLMTLAATSTGPSPNDDVEACLAANRRLMDRCLELQGDWHQGYCPGTLGYCTRGTSSVRIPIEPNSSVGTGETGGPKTCGDVTDPERLRAMGCIAEPNNRAATPTRGTNPNAAFQDSPESGFQGSPGLPSACQGELA